MSAGEVGSHFDVSRPAVSQHLNVLKEAGLVSERRNGTKRLYSLRPEGLAELKEFLERFWIRAYKPSNAKPRRRSDGSMDATTETAIAERTTASAPRPERVWEFFVDPEKLKRWKGIDAKLEPRPGGVYWCEVIPGHVAAGEYVELDPPHRLGFTWGGEKSDSPTAIKPGSSTIVVELTPEGSGTRLHFVHRDLPSEAAAESHGVGWDHY